MNPTVSVINPCYNQAHFLPEAIESVVSQTFTDMILQKKSAEVRPSRVLIACTHFWPSIGGLETIAEFLGNYLVRTGYQVDVATLYRQDRSNSLYRGVNIVSLDAFRKFNDTPLWILELRQLVTSGQYDACILMADPLNPIIWSLHQANIPSKTKIIIQPIINKDGYAKWCDNKTFRQKLADVLKKAHAVVALTRGGVEMQYFKEEGIASILIPNAVDTIVPTIDFRAKFNIAKNSFVILHIANLWPVKNHLGILDALRSMPPDWRLVMIGYPSQEKGYVLQVQESIRSNPQVVYIPGLPREEVAAALESADIVILASLGEVSPVTILEAMSHKKPWMATPECGAVHDLAGGVIVPLNDFAKVLSLLANSEYLQKLGSVGYDHWQACYCWPTVILAWDELIQTASTQKTFDAPESLRQRQETLQAQIAERLNEVTTLTLNMPLVSVVIPCYNQANYLPEAIEAVVRQSFTGWECIIVNDGSTDNTNTVAEKLVHKYPDKQIRIVTQINQGLSCARNSGIKMSRGKYILPLDADDLIHPEMLQKTVSLLKTNLEIAIAYTDVKYFGKTDWVVCSGEYDFQKLCRQNHFNYCSLYRRSTWEAVGGYNPNMIWGYEDWDFWIGCGEKGFYGKRIPEPLFLYRVKDASMYTNAIRHHSELVSQIVLNHQNLYNPNTVAEAKGIIEKCSNGRLQNHPVVSVIVPTYNRPDFLTKALESIAAQTYKCCEIIVVNDAGRDVSACVNSFQGRLAITYLAHTENKGLAASRNTGINAASGKYIAYLDDDDVYYPDHIETLVSFLENNDYKVAYTDAYRAYQEKENGEYVTRKRAVAYSYDFEYDYILVNNFIPVLCIMHEKDCLRETGLFDESLRALEDMDCWIRMSRKYKFAHIKRVTCEFTWREDGTSITSGQRPEFLKAIHVIYDKYREYTLNKPHVLKAQEELLSELKLAITSRDNTFKHNHIFCEKRQTCAVIIPVFNKVEFTKKCIESIISNTPQNQFEIIIIDNASTDATKDFLKSLVGNIRVITNEKNLGFAKACNQGAEVASNEYLLFLNNDTEPEKGWLEPLIEVLDKDPSVGAVGSKLLYPTGTIQHAGVTIVDSKKAKDPLLPLHIYANESSHFPDANQLFQYQALTAACLLIRKSAFNETGGFDEGYWNGYEDVDLCFNLQEKGWKLVYQPESVVIHHESKSGPERFSMVSKNIQRLHNKWIGKIKPDIIINEDGSTVVVENSKIQRYLLPYTNLVKTFDKKQLITVSIVMLTWNALDYTKKCVHSIQYHTGYPHEIIFVDNASTDGTVEYLRCLIKEHSNYKLIENKENRGFAVGNNQGVTAAGGEYVCLLNNDVLVSDGWLESLVESLEKDVKIGTVGPITNSISGRQMVNSIPYTDEAGFHEFSQKIRKACYGRLTPRYRIAGFAMLMKKSLYEEVGGLDESFGTGNYEDDDLCLKIRDKGYAIMVDESVFIHHYRSQTFIENKIDYRSNLSVNESKFVKKWPDVDYKSLLELDKSLVDINADLVSQGQKLIESGNTDEAIKVYLKVLSTNPIDEAALCGVGMTYQMVGKTDGAIDAYKKVIRKYTYFSQQPRSGGNSYLLDAYHNLALLYAGANQLDDAIFMLKKAIELSSSDASILNNLGVLYFKKKMHTRAAQCFSDALSIDAHYEEAKKNLEKVLISCNDNRRQGTHTGTGI